MTREAAFTADLAAGYRRRFAIVPELGRVTAQLEDDFHHMAVTLHHDGASIVRVEAATYRVPWSTCPGAALVLESHFTGASLAAASAHADKRQNCTHLYDLAALAAAHALDGWETVYDAVVSDPAGGTVHATLHCNGVAVLQWRLEDDVLASPHELAGTHLAALKGWIATLAPEDWEAARVLQWACFVAHGRRIPLDQQSDATKMPPNCYSFQPRHAAVANRIGEIIDFGTVGRMPLDRA